MKQLLSTKKISIYWTNLDGCQQVNPVNYFDYMTETRHDLLVKPYLPGQQESLFLVDVSCEFKHPLTYPSVITVKQYSEQIGNSSFVLSYDILNSQADYCAVGKATVVLVNKKDSNKSIAIPAYLKKALGVGLPAKQAVKPLTIDTTTLLNTKIISLRWADIDAFGHVDNARYFDFMAEARNDLFLPVYTQDNGYLFSLEASRCTFQRELHYPSDLRVQQYLVTIDGSRVTLGYRFLGKHGDDIYATGLATIVSVDSNSKQPISAVAELIKNLAASEGPRGDL